MIDIHAHILPWIDDGAADMFDTMEMAKIAVDSGITEMVATPHCNIPGMFDNYYNREYMEVFRQTRQALKEEGIPLTLYPGMEVFVTPDVPELLSRGKLLTLNESRYLLVEFAFGEDPMYVGDMLKEIREMGVRPVIAHAERYEFVQDNPQIAYEWRESGYLIQVNKSSFLGRFGRYPKKTAHQLLSHNLVSVIASDAHSPYERTPWMLETYEELAKVYPEKYLQVLFEENPRRICENERTLRFEAKPFD